MGGKKLLCWFLLGCFVAQRLGLAIRENTNRIYMGKRVDPSETNVCETARLQQAHPRMHSCCLGCQACCRSQDSATGEA